MKFLYSNIPPLRTLENQITIKDCILKNFEENNSVEIAVGYVSKDSLLELDALVDKYEIKNICLILGMYFIKGMPITAYDISVDLNNKWKREGIGEIRIAHNFLYHGKIYVFKNETNITAIVGSSNLSVLKPDGSNLRQYESAIYISDVDNCTEISNFFSKLKKPVISSNIDDISIPIIKEGHEFLNNIELVTKISNESLIDYEKNKTDISYIIPIKAPPFEGRFSNKREYCTRSHINTCYSGPKNKKNPKPRDWFETQITVSENIRDENWPIDSDFYIITDDGYQFKAHTHGDNNKQLGPKGNELILGYWIKGRLINEGLIRPRSNVEKDVNRDGMVTREILAEYGCNEYTFTKSTKKIFDEEENRELDVWLLSFKSNKEV